MDSSRLCTRQLPEGVCPLLFPILVEDKQAVAELLRSDGIDVLEFWNHGACRAEAEGAGGPAKGRMLAFFARTCLACRFIRTSRPRHIDYIACTSGPPESEDVVTIELIEDSRRFDALQAEWSELLEASAVESPFLTWEWLNAWWTHLKESRRLAIRFDAQRRSIDRDRADGCRTWAAAVLLAMGVPRDGFRRL